MSRNERFVSAAKRLLAMQVGACVVAAGVAGWAFFEVRGLVRERDALAARVAQLEGGAPPAPGQPVAEPVAEIGQTLVSTTSGGTAAPADATPIEPAGNTSGGGGVPPRDDKAVDTGGGGQTTGGGTGTATGGGDTQPADGGTTNSVNPAPTDPVEPPAERNCRLVDRRPIVCVPPYTRTPVPGVCLDGRRRLMRCPAGEPRRDPPRDPKPDEPPLTRR